MRFSKVDSSDFIVLLSAIFKKSISCDKKFYRYTEILSQKKIQLL